MKRSSLWELWNKFKERHHFGLQLLLLLDFICLGAPQRNAEVLLAGQWMNIYPWCTGVAQRFKGWCKATEKSACRNKELLQSYCTLMTSPQDEHNVTKSAQNAQLHVHGHHLRELKRLARTKHSCVMEESSEPIPSILVTVPNNWNVKWTQADNSALLFQRTAEAKEMKGWGFSSHTLWKPERTSELTLKYFISLLELPL